ncbi:MAG: hypothetical protein ABI890_14360 [Lapillicoccus sp.]
MALLDDDAHVDGTLGLEPERADQVKHLPGRHKATDITLTRGVVSEAAFRSWATEPTSGDEGEPERPETD